MAEWNRLFRHVADVGGPRRAGQVNQADEIDRRERNRDRQERTAPIDPRRKGEPRIFVPGMLAAQNLVEFPVGNESPARADEARRNSRTQGFAETFAHSTAQNDIEKERGMFCRIRASAPDPATVIRRRNLPREVLLRPRERLNIPLPGPQRPCEDIAEPCGETLLSNVVGVAETISCCSRERLERLPKCVEQSGDFGYSHQPWTSPGPIPGSLKHPGRWQDVFPVRCSDLRGAQASLNPPL